MRDEICRLPPADSRVRIGVLVIHGMTGTPLEMRPVSRFLKRQGYRVEVPLLRGHGAGHQELLATTWRDWLAGVREEADTLCAECDQVFVVGLSVSALLATLVAADNPRICGVVLLSTHLGLWRKENLPWNYFLFPFVTLTDFLRRHVWWTEKPPYGIKDIRLQNKIEAAIKSSKNGETEANGLFRTYVESIYQANLLVVEALKQAPNVRAPALVLHSMEDTLYGVNNATRIYSRLGSSCKEIVLITGCDHVMTVDLRKDDVARLVYEFISHTGRFSPVGGPVL